MKSSVYCCNYGYMYCCCLWQQFSELEIYINYHEKKHLKLLIWEYAICILKRDILKENCRYICVPYDFNKFFAKILKFLWKRTKVLCQFICFKLQKETFKTNYEGIRFSGKLGASDMWNSMQEWIFSKYFWTVAFAGYMPFFHNKYFPEQ